MKKMKLLIIKIFLGLLCCCLFSCKKQVDESNRPEFIGLWSCGNDGSGSGTSDYGFEIEISSNSYGWFKEYNFKISDIKTKNGKVRASDNILKIGHSSFVIDEYPQEIDTSTIHMLVYTDSEHTIVKKANWKMKLNTSTFGPYCRGTYYKADY